MQRLSIAILVLLVFAVFSILSVKAETINLQITEIMANPEGDDTKLEWIEIINISSTIENLSDWTLAGKQLPALIINPGSIVVLVRDEQAFSSTYQVDTGLIKADFSLVNAGGELILQNINNNQRSTFSYGISEEGKSFERLVGECDLIRKNDSSHTVGKANTDCSILNITVAPTVIYTTATKDLPEIMFSSILPHPETGDEWLELFNNSGGDVDLEGYTIVDKTGKAYTISAVTIRAQEKLKFYPKNVSLNNEGDTISLLDKNLNRIDLIIYGESKKGVPFELLQGTSVEVTVSLIPTLAEITSNSTIKTSNKSLDSNNLFFRIPIYYESDELK